MFVDSNITGPATVCIPRNTTLDRHEECLITYLRSLGRDRVSDGAVSGTLLVLNSGATYSTLTFIEDGVGLFAIAMVTSTDDTELLSITP
jgi:hypothetical protein